MYVAFKFTMRTVGLLFVLATCINIIKGECLVSVNGDLPARQPLVLNPGLGAGFRYPVDGAGTLRFAAGENVRLVCAGTNNRLVNLAGTPTEAIATCVSGTQFSVNGVSIQFNQLGCNSIPWHWQRRTGNKCLGQYTEIELGFDLNNNEWIPMQSICFDEVRLTTVYTEYTIVKEIGGWQRGTARPSWFQGEFYSGYAMATQYNRAVQTATIGTVLGSTDLGSKYIHPTNEYFMARGHLAARADFVYETQHRATFYYINAQPHWQTFNAGNWETLESDIRAFLFNTQQDVTCWTGVHGVAQLPDVNENLTDLYFYADNAGNRAIPIPKFFWKIIYNEKTQLGTAFVGVNNPYLVNITSDYFLCEDISAQIPWLTWKADSVPLGISYACTVDSLRNAIGNVPSFTVRGILA